MLSSRILLDDWPVKRFRPNERPDYLRDVFRYDEKAGMFVPDDGQESLAFYGKCCGFAYSWYINPPCHDNILRRWFSDEVWHLMTRRVPTPEEIRENRGIGNPYVDWNDHPNVVAERKASNECSKKHGCCNGQSSFLDDLQIHPTFPFLCVLCENEGRGHQIIRLDDRIRNNSRFLAQAVREIADLEIQVSTLDRSYKEARTESVLLEAEMKALFK